MLLVCGTIPNEKMPLIFGKASLDGAHLIVEGWKIPCGQGTAAMISACCAVTDYLRLDAPYALLAGDCGNGVGSRSIYKYITEHIDKINPTVLCLHYLMPIMALMKRIVDSIERCKKRPLLIADAGSMYAAKAAGLASSFELFTPDPAELAFLADPKATHPSYISKYLFNCLDVDAVSLIEQAYKHKNAAKYLLVKGRIDYVVCNGKIEATVSEPDILAMEAIGGTGDTITGLVAAFLYAGLKPVEAALIAAKANRSAGKYALANASTKIAEIIAQFKGVFKDNLQRWLNVNALKEDKK